MERPAGRRGWEQRVLVAAGLALLGASALAGLDLATPPPDHVAPGCWWWTARPVDDVAAGDRGCFRGYFTPGGGLADAARDPTVVLRLDLPQTTCRMREGDATVVWGEAVYSEGHTTILVDRCR